MNDTVEHGSRNYESLTDCWKNDTLQRTCSSQGGQLMALSQDLKIFTNMNRIDLELHPAHNLDMGHGSGQCSLVVSAA